VRVPLRLVVALAVLVGASLAGPSFARAAEQTIVLKAGLYAIKPYAAEQGIVRVPSPGLDGYLTGLKVELVDQAGKVLSYRDVMLTTSSSPTSCGATPSARTTPASAARPSALLPSASSASAKRASRWRFRKATGIPSPPQISGAWSTC
jgi:hypothetical protein